MTNVLRVKDGTKFAVIAAGGFRLLAALDDACQVLKHDLTITAGTNDHSEGRHPLGEAYDVSVRGLLDSEIVTLVMTLRRRLGPSFTVFYEAPAVTDPMLASISLINPHATGAHVHMQVKKGESFPPADRSIEQVYEA